MALTITWSDGVNPDTVYNITDEVQASLESYRQAIRPIMPDVQSMIVDTFMEQVVKKAIAMFPLASVETAKQNLAVAQQALDDAVSGLIAVQVSLPPQAKPQNPGKP